MEAILNWAQAHIDIIYIVVLSIFLGIEVIGRVPSVLHTPLMSGANAIHGAWYIKCSGWFCSYRPHVRNV
jgi:NAD(P) transhydrogenase subunit alpha